MSAQVAETEQRIVVSLPAPLVKKVAEITNIDPADEKLSDYIANMIREVLASRDLTQHEETESSESEEIRARLKKIGYL